MGEIRFKIILKNRNGLDFKIAESGAHVVLQWKSVAHIWTGG